MLNTPPFTCGSSTVFYDGQPYNTVLIGTQCWLKENLNVGTMINGSSNQTNNSLIEKYCYDYNLVNCSIYGGLYQWDELMQYSTIEGSKGICPAGWHIPSNNEWCALTTYIDPTVNCNNFGWLGTDAGKKIREAGNTHWDADNTGTNESGFTAFGAGLFDVSSGYMGLLINAYFGTSTENNTTNFFNWNLEYNDDPIGRSSSDKSIGVSVRCLKDN
ncbi:MAG: hypothetical protein NTU44_16055 [Bacteroidetes bacterium]|nr:hypothetical protein [Bacteroidota bacterium]